MTETTIYDTIIDKFESRQKASYALRWIILLFQRSQPSVAEWNFPTKQSITKRTNKEHKVIINTIHYIYKNERRPKEEDQEEEWIFLVRSIIYHVWILVCQHHDEQYEYKFVFCSRCCQRTTNREWRRQQQQSCLKPFLWILWHCLQWRVEIVAEDHCGT